MIRVTIKQTYGLKCDQQFFLSLLHTNHLVHTSSVAVFIHSSENYHAGAMKTSSMMVMTAFRVLLSAHCCDLLLAPLA
jgi:hypothetical protein